MVTAIAAVCEGVTVHLIVIHGHGYVLVLAMACPPSFLGLRNEPEGRGVHNLYKYLVIWGCLGLRHGLVSW